MPQTILHSIAGVHAASDETAPKNAKTNTVPDSIISQPMRSCVDPSQPSFSLNHNFFSESSASTSTSSSLITYCMHSSREHHPSSSSTPGASL